MRRILVGYIIDGKKSGIDKYLLNMLKSLEGQGYCFDFLTNEIDADLQKELERYGSRLYQIPRLKHPCRQFKIICDTIKQHKYDAAYFNISEAFNCMGILAAHICKVPKIIVHSHSSGCDTASKSRWVKLFLHKMAKRLLPYWANHYVACSDKAAIWMFPEKLAKKGQVQIILNGIDVKKFNYNENVRQAVRTEMGWHGKKVLLHVGSFLYVKNHPFLIEIMKLLREKNEEYHLVLVGDGPLKADVETLVKKNSLQSCVEFLGVRSDVARLMQGSDMFLLPSHFEGMPLTAVEAQVSGNLCFLSDTITKDAKIGEHCRYLSVNDAAAWAEQIKQYEMHKKEPFVNTSGKMIDIMEQAEIFKTLFEK